MHGLGNDFVILDARHDGWLPHEEQVRLVAHRRLGIGCDQLMVLHPSKTPGTAAYLHIFNHDGSVTGACGNGTRCVGRLLCEQSNQDSIVIETRAGQLVCWRDDAVQSVDMGPPQLEWQQIPLAHEAETLKVNIGIGNMRDPVAVSMGNPHAVFFVQDVNQINISALGPQIEHHPMFPQRTNVEIVHVINRKHLRMRVWERGVGMTAACGSGACAALVAAVRRGLADRAATLTLDGGDLFVTWREDNHVVLSGSTVLVASGTITDEAMAVPVLRSVA